VAATVSPASPPEHGFQLAFTRTRCALGPAARGYSPSATRPREAHRLLQSKRSVSTPGDGPNSDAYAEANLRRSEGAGRETDTHRVFSGQGPRALRSRCWPPPGRPLVSVDLPQPVRPEHPSSRARAVCGVETTAHDAHAVTWALSNEPAWRTTPEARRTVRVAAAALSRKKHDCKRYPGVLSTTELSGHFVVTLPGRPARSRDESRCRLGVAFFSRPRSRR